MNNGPAIDVHEVTKTYRDGRWSKRHINALQAVTLDVQQGEIFGLLGPNGAGKTTFIKVLLGIVRTTSGSAKLLGLPAGDRRGRRRVGYLPENLRMPRYHTANSALAYYGGLSGLTRRQVIDRRGALLERVGLQDRARDKIYKYSKGMLQRLGLAQSLIHEPDLLILDEPTDGLDPVARAEVRRILTELKAEGKTIFVNSHLLQEVELICDRVAILDKGHLRRVGPVDEITAGAASSASGSSTSIPNRVQQLRLTMQLGGPESTIRAVLEGNQLDNWHSTGTDRFQLVVHLPDQSAVDRCIDHLRRAGISIISLSPQRVTLEDAFLDVVDEPQAGS